MKFTRRDVAIKNFSVIIGFILFLVSFSPCYAVEMQPEYQSIEGWNFTVKEDPFSLKTGGICRVYYTSGPSKHYNFVNQWGELLTKDGFDEAGDFSEGLAYIKYGSTAGYMDVSGALVIPVPNGAECSEFSEGTAYIGNEVANITPRIINRSGKTVLTPPDGISFVGNTFSEGLLVAMDGTTGKYGYLDHLGNWAIQPQFDGASDFFHGSARVYMNHKEGMIDQSGTIRIPCIYDSIEYIGSSESYEKSYTEGDPLLYRTWIKDPLLPHGHEGLINTTTWEIVTEPQTEWQIVGTFENGRCPVFYRDASLFGIIDERGKQITGPLYEKIGYSYGEGLLQVMADSQLKYVDENGDDVLVALANATLDDYASSFGNGLALIQNEFLGTCSMIDLSGHELFALDGYTLYSIDYAFPQGVMWAHSSHGSNEEIVLIFDPRLRDYTSPWAEGEMKQAKAAGLVTESNDSYFTFRITRRRFAELAANLVEQATGQTITPAAEGTFTDTDDLWVRKAAAIGLVNGLGDGSRFSPNGYISREQLAAMLYRAIRYIESQAGTTILAEQGSLEGYTDAAQVSPWAQEAVAALHAAGILKGTSGTTLSPKDTTTVEQGILLTLRAYQAV